MITYCELTVADKFSFKHFVKQQGLKQPKPDDKVFLVKKHQRIIGLAKIQAFDNQAWLHGLYIQVDQRQQGYGSGLVDFICNQLKQPCCGFIQPERQTFYQHLGFEACAEHAIDNVLIQRFRHYQKTKPRLTIWCYNK
jgi:N-acetylglutamate synthase-like GNAT family acetyltransferase